MNQNISFNQIALNPSHSVVIEACAGSGKTWLLVARIVRLLLADVKPHEILAITFTRKAAQEMSARLNEWLQFLATAPDQACRNFLLERALTDKEIEWALPKARRLFEECLTAQPGITINTFHGWFLQLLQRAPLASGVSANFSLIEQTSLLIEDAWQEFAKHLQSQEKYHTAYEFLLRKARDFNTKKLLVNFISKRAEWWAFTKDHQDPIAYVLSRLEHELGVTPDSNVLENLFKESSFLTKLSTLSAALRTGTEGLVKLSAEIDMALNPDRLQERFSVIENIFFTAQGSPRKNIETFFEKNPGKKNIYLDICRELQTAKQKLCNQEIMGFNRAGLFCGAGLLSIYQEMKSKRQLMDFSDVEWQAFNLLNDNQYAAYMLHKLDHRYKHILVDEFQDTNPLQWQSLLAWFNAYDANEIRPTIFLVGDPKQSIYRFRRADARLFDIASEFLKTQYGAHYLNQNVTRRNAQGIVETINRVFINEEKFPHFVPHVALHSELSGAVEILPLVEIIETESSLPISGLRNPLLTAFIEVIDLRRQSEAQEFASRLKEIVKNYNVVDEHGKKRRARYSDVMVLIRSRTHLMEYETALRHAQIPYLSTRQGGLLNTLEVTDLIALLEFLVTPFSDLKLAQALRSPIFSCTDDDLMALACVDQGSWWQRLQYLVSQQTISSTLTRAHRLLENWIIQVDTLPVHDLLDHIYYQSDLLERYQLAVDPVMRAAIKANLQAFMKLALTLDSGRYPSLPRFINELANLRSASLQEAPDEGEAELNTATDAVRLLTIHGAKGLEAPIVWLLNTNHNESQAESYDVILNWPPGVLKPTHFSLYSVKEERGQQREVYFNVEQEYAEREDLNLLYVALTRAKQWLFVSGCENSRANQSWYAKLQAVTDFPAVEINDEMLLEGRAKINTEKDNPENLLPLLNILPIGKREKSINTPAQQRGILLHTFLEHPSKLDKVYWQNKFSLSKAEFDDLYAEAEKIIKAPHLERFFNPQLYLHAWSEFSYADNKGGVRRIDRLIEFKDELWILDYKMGELASEAHQTSLHKKQLREYVAAAKNFFPNKNIRAALIFANAELIEVQ